MSRSLALKRRRIVGLLLRLALVVMASYLAAAIWITETKGTL